MRGGKREGSGRKGFGETKTIRIPVGIEAQVKALIAAHRAGKDNGGFENVTKPKTLVKPKFPRLTPEQTKRLRDWLVECRFARSMADARKMTDTPRLCRDAFRDNIHHTEEWQNEPIMDLLELYATDP